MEKTIWSPCLYKTLSGLRGLNDNIHQNTDVHDTSDIYSIILSSHKQPSKHGPMLFQYWPIVFDAGPTLKQHWANVLCVMGGHI